MAAWLSLALVFGGLLSGALGLIIIGSLWLAPDAWISDYPPDIRDKYGEMSERGRRLRPYVAGAFFGVTFAVLLIASLRLSGTTAAAPTYVEYFRLQFVILMSFNAFDLLVLDWLLFVTLQPQQLVLPGTAGMAGSGNYGFHFRGFLVGILFSAVGAAVFAGIAIVLVSLIG